MDFQTPPRTAQGRATSEELGKFSTQPLLYGSYPKFEPALPFAADPSVTYETYQVVTIGADGVVVPAKKGTPASGVIEVGATGVSKINVWTSGCFEVDALVWDASYATDTDKENAFLGASNPTHIVARKRKF